MARRGLPSLLIGLMTVLNGTVMLLGPGLHGLPGCGHHTVAIRAAGSVDDGLRVASGRGDHASPCPVCEYLAQGQVVAGRALTAAPDRSSPAVTVLSFLSPDLRPQRAFGCRAPPADSPR
jgi:hypothetical protein